jgi:hypothetical protein
MNDEKKNSKKPRNLKKKQKKNKAKVMTLEKLSLTIEANNNT